MLTLHFGGRPLCALTALEVSREAGPQGTSERWRAQLELEGATALLAEKSAAALEACLQGQGTLELRHGATPLRSLDMARCEEGPALERFSLDAGDDAQAHPRRTFRLVFRALLAAPAAETPASPLLRRESISTGQKWRIVDLPLLAPGAQPWRQEIGAPVVEVVQEGQEEGDDAAAPPPLYPAALVERSVEHLFDHESRSVRWRYVMRPLFFVQPPAPSRP